MDIEEEKQHLHDKISEYEASILSLKNDIIQYCKKIEHLEKTQDSLEAIISKSTIPILYGNKKGQIIGANNKALELTQLNLDEILQKNFNEILVNQNVSEVISNKIFKKNSNEISNEQILIKKNGKKIFVNTNTKLLPNNTYQISIKKINKRKNAELALAEVQNRYKQLAETIQDVVWTATLEMHLVYISGSISRITGFSPETYYQKPLNELITPISYQLLLDTISKETDSIATDPKLKSKYPITLEIKLLQKQHSSVWVELSIALILNQFGKVAGFQGILRNIDDQKKTQENLYKSNQRYNFAIKSVGTGVWELNADLTSISIDDNLLSILGYNSKNPKSLLNDWINLTLKEDRIAIIDSLQDILDGRKQSAGYECRRIHKNGTLLWFSDYVEGIYDDENNIIELLGTSKNITNEKLTEEKKYKYYAGLQMLIESTFQFLKFDKLEQIYNYTGHMLAKKIPESFIVFCSIEADSNRLIPFKYFGLDEHDFVKEIESHMTIDLENYCQVSKKALNLLSQKFLIEFKHGFDEFFQQKATGKNCSSIRNRYKNYSLQVIGTGTDKSLTESILIIIKDGSELSNKEFIEAFISLSSIIIDKKKIEVELKKSNETKDKFFSIISHDLKNPFNAIIGFSNLIIQGIYKMEKEKIHEFATLINDSAVQSHKMMNNLFEWVKSQKTALKCRPVKIDIVELITSNIDLISSEAKNKKIEIVLKKGPETDFYADGDMMDSILRNIISNAVKFTNIGGRIDVSYKLQGNEVVFSIKDDGVGIPQKTQKDLFKLSTKISTIGTNNEKGTGLGLLLCNEFVSLHGGKIWVESEPDKGSQFLFTIPISK